MNKVIKVSNDGANWFEVKPSNLNNETSLGWWLEYGPRTFISHTTEDGTEREMVYVDELLEFLSE